MIWWSVAVIAGIVLVFALLAPLESLRWWSRRSDASVLATITKAAMDDDGEPELATGVTGGGAASGVDPEAASGQSSAITRPSRYVVYLSGIGTVDGLSGSRRERAVLDAVAERLPQVRVISDVFPYAVDNRGLTQRSTTWFWRRVARLQKIPVARVISYLINLRNALRVLVSVDPRYGPTFNVALAQEIVESLHRQGYRFSHPVPVTVIGYSGGGQMALGASLYLAACKIPVSVISIGGVLSADPALDKVEHVWHFWGSKDRTHLLADVVFPGRWPTAKFSSWQRAKRQGRVTETEIGPMRHQGGRDYFDRHHTVADGRSYRELTTEALVQALS